MNNVLVKCNNVLMSDENIKYFSKNKFLFI